MKKEVRYSPENLNWVDPEKVKRWAISKYGDFGRLIFGVPIKNSSRKKK